MKPFIGLGGILIAAMVSGFNDQVTSIALVDIRGALGISYDPGTWIQSLYGSAEIVGMACSPWLLTTFTLRRWTLFSIALCGVASILIPFSPNIESIYALRLLQGFAGGLIIPLLMVTALRALKDPKVRLYGLAFYALTASFTSGLAASLSALWTDLVGWRFVFFQALPLCTVAAALVWYGDPQDQPHYERFHCADWRGVLLAVIGFGAFSTMLYQGDRLDWFNSQLICVFALISAVAIPLFIVNEWCHPIPLMRPQLLGRRNLAYGAIALFIFIIIAQAGSTVPLQFLQQVQGYRPLQSNPITLEIALLQIVLLPAVAFLLDFRRVDARVVSFHRARVDAVGMHRLVFCRLHLESRSILPVAGLSGHWATAGDHAVVDVFDKCCEGPLGSALRVFALQHPARPGGSCRRLALRVDRPLARQPSFRTHH
jgi:MFS transporter, DHA2 family, multidrug resistance protein